MKKLKFFKIDPNINLEIDGMVMKIFPVETRNSIETKMKDRLDDRPENKQKKSLKKVKKVEDLIKTDPYNKRKLRMAVEGFWRAQEEMN